MFDFPNPIFAWVKVNPKPPRKGFCPRMTKFGNCKYCEGKGDSDDGKGKGKSWGGGIQAPSGQMLEKYGKMPGEFRGPVFTMRK